MNGIDAIAGYVFGYLTIYGLSGLGIYKAWNYLTKAPKEKTSRKKTVAYFVILIISILIMAAGIFSLFN